ncbi:riboflavin synthase subunit alpha [Endozoicomonas sp. ONNA1]|uniref:riboflavin synthase subunit alpha n=1 Tax=Endozoicomonas sp. ONNA1 TaxID=2828740 RepID=UPI0021486D6C|nr:riboflavin synthase subunit alpha [Endozoicomonas sp. ONNA1]
MFTGIVQGTAKIERVDDHDSIRTFDIEFPENFCQGLNTGASVAVDGVCLTVTDIVSPTRARFDVILQSLRVTTLGDYVSGQSVNVERAAIDGAEIGGHPLSGHIDFRAQILALEEIEGNCRVRFVYDHEWGQYIFPKGYIAINGCSLTLSDVDKKNDCFEVWLIPETRRVTTFSDKKAGDWANIEIERGTQVIVDTIRDTLEKQLGALYPALEALMEEKNINLAESLTSSFALLEKKNTQQNG